MNDMQLTEHFRLSEFVKSLTAKARGIDNTPPAEAVENLKHLCDQVLEPLRAWAGRPVEISSGYRCRALNDAIGGAPYSQHLKGEAADLIVPSESIGLKWYEYIQKHLPHDQLIWETIYGICWIHVSCRRDLKRNRKQSW